MNLQTQFDARDVRGPHLSTEQMDELLGGAAASSSEHCAARAHLDSCRVCAAELQGLREALLDFRETTAAYASEQMAMPRTPAAGRLPHVAMTSGPLLWTAAGVVFFASLLPLELHREHAKPVQPAAASSAVNAESDEALMEDVNRELNAGIPASMQPLADPAGTTFSSPDGTTSTTRKD